MRPRRESPSFSVVPFRLFWPLLAALGSLMGRTVRGAAVLAGVVAVVAAAARPSQATQVVLKDGRVLTGGVAPVAGLADILQPRNSSGSGPLRLILMVDDDLRRTYVSKRLMIDLRQDDPGEIAEKFRIWQRARQSGQEVSSLGPIMRVTPFDEYGRRIITLSSTDKQVDVIQGITELTPTYAKVEGLNLVWDMRMATSSIPRDVLHKILLKQIDPTSVDDRKKIARFYLQAHRYEEATAELEAILADFPHDDDVRQQIAPSIRALKQQSARRLLDELELRRDAGQHAFVYQSLKTFPTDGVAGEILQAVREMVEQYDSAAKLREKTLKQFDGLLEKAKDETQRKKLSLVRYEMGGELNLNTLGRLAAFRQMAGDESLSAEERLALAASGWLVGSDTAVTNLPVALSMFEVRGLVRQYLSTPDKLSRAKVFDEIEKQEAGAPQYVARLLALMKPPLELPQPIDGKPGYYELAIEGPQATELEYLVQLPPEYDPHRSYPAMVTLHGAGSDASRQIDWWAGAWTKGGWRAGQASRHGYIVIAPKWAQPHQRQYRYSALEHAAVLYCLRDAFRHFSVDTDRVFLSGHSMGGDAAWDIGLAHPDLWAGVIPIVATSDRYCNLYWENAQWVPFYFVAGELDGNRMARNARDLDRYLKRGYNATVVEYRGRGHENFSDEIQHLFDWMGRFQRDFFPKQFETRSMRPWDNFFWWLELKEMPPAAMVYPADWPPPRTAHPVVTEAKLTANNGIYVKSGAGKVTVWLAPEMLDFDRQVTININGHRVTARVKPDDSGASPSQRRQRTARVRFVEPDLETLLEDVRTRADRQHPFWAKVRG